jgi:hypothetical protein
LIIDNADAFGVDVSVDADLHAAEATPG